MNLTLNISQILNSLLKINLSILFVMLFLFTSISFAQSTGESGSWEDNNTWLNSNSPGLNIRNNYSGHDIIISREHTVYLGDENNKKNLTINKNGFTLTIRGQLSIHGDLQANNDLTINIKENARLAIYGNVEVRNNLVLNVEQSGTFRVKGDIDMSNNAELEIEGVVVAETISGGNGSSISGSGEIYVEEIIGSIESDDFGGYIVGDNTCIDVPAPEHLVVQNSVGKNVLRWKWDDNNNEIENLTFWGFQVFRNNTGQTHYDGIIVGNLDGDAYQKKHYEDNLKDMTEEDRYIYYVRAVYIVRSENKRSEEFVFSPISNKVESSNDILPIVLADFNAKQKSDFVQISWTTASETNNNYFTIERSSNMTDWEEIAFVNGSGNTNTCRTYQINDYDALSGTNYYRLKQTDYDGTFEYFHAVAVNFSANITNEIVFNVYPNPATDYIMIDIADFDKAGLLVIRDNSGKLVKQYNLNYSGLHNISISNLKKGSYHLHYYYNNKPLAQKRIIVI